MTDSARRSEDATTYVTESARRSEDATTYVTESARRSEDATTYANTSSYRYQWTCIFMTFFLLVDVNFSVLPAASIC